ncbi:MAG TPA: carboxymuconolactone decarboxylase family protein [Armatimonadota bacterium]
MTRDEIYADVKQAFGLVPEFITRIPDNLLEYDWGTIKTVLFSDTALPSKEKYLMCLAIAASQQDLYCVYFFRGAATLAGATEEELNEAGHMAMLIAGFGTLFASTGLTHEEFRQENDKAFAYMRQQGQQKAA